jgi:hypothetical protein
MTLRAFVVVLALMVPSAAMADPITASGLWSPTMTPPSADPTALPLEATAFWSNWSWDGPLMGLVYRIDAYHTENLEYLHNPDGSAARFRFDEEIINQSFLFGITSRTTGVFGINEFGAFTYDDGVGPRVNSWDNGEQFALFRIVGPDTTRYILGVEDMPVSAWYSDRDYNDYVTSFQTASVPEPGTLLLMGSGMAMLAAQRRRAARKARSEAAN